MAYIYDIADTWSGGGAFTGIKLNVTDGGSTAGSLLMDLQVGGSSKFSVDKNSVLTANEGRFGAQVTAGVAFSVTSSGVLRLPVSGNIGFTPTGAAGSVADLLLARDAANTLAQRNGVNAQAFNLYNTYTDASNYERGFMRFVSNVLEIGTVSAGTGSTRGMELSTPYGGPLVQLTNNVWDFCNTNRSFPTIRMATGIGINVAPTFQFTFNSATYLTSGAADTGLARSAAGVAKITNGSTGTGQLIFIVPTTNPGITGALWNNAGTLAIS